MANIKNLEMAEALSANEHIEIKSGFLGFGRKAVYRPTQSAMTVTVQDYAPDAGAQMERLLKLPIEKLAAEVQAKGKPQSTPVGQYRLEVVASPDGRYVVMQLFRFADYRYLPVTDVLCYEGQNAETVAIVI